MWTEDARESANHAIVVLGAPTAAGTAATQVDHLPCRIATRRPIHFERIYQSERSLPLTVRHDPVHVVRGEPGQINHQRSAVAPTRQQMSKLRGKHRSRALIVAQAPPLPEDKRVAEGRQPLDHQAALLPSARASETSVAHARKAQLSIEVECELHHALNGGMHVSWQRDHRVLRHESPPLDQDDLGVVGAALSDCLANFGTQILEEAAGVPCRCHDGHRGLRRAAAQRGQKVAHQRPHLDLRTAIVESQHDADEVW